MEKFTQIPQKLRDCVCSKNNIYWPLLNLFMRVKAKKKHRYNRMKILFRFSLELTGNSNRQRASVLDEIRADTRLSLDKQLKLCKSTLICMNKHTNNYRRIDRRWQHWRSYKMASRRVSAVLAELTSSQITHSQMVPLPFTKAAAVVFPFFLRGVAPLGTNTYDIVIYNTFIYLLRKRALFSHSHLLDYDALARLGLACHGV